MSNKPFRFSPDRYRTEEYKKLTTPQKFVYHMILVTADADSLKCYPSFNCLSEMTGYSRRTIIKVIIELETLGLIEISRQQGIVNKYKVRLIKSKKETSAEDAPDTRAGDAPVPVHEVHRTRAGDAPKHINNMSLDMCYNTTERYKLEEVKTVLVNKRKEMGLKESNRIEQTDFNKLKKAITREQQNNLIDNIIIKEYNNKYETKNDNLLEDNLL